MAAQRVRELSQPASKSPPLLMSQSVWNSSLALRVDESHETSETIDSVNVEDAPKPLPKRRKKNGKWTTKMKLAASVAREAKKSLLRSFMHLPQDVVLEVRSRACPAPSLFHND